MMRFLPVAYFYFLSFFCFSQETIKVQDFSDRYYGKVYVEDINEVFSPGWVAIYEKSTDKELIKVESEELAVGYTDKGEVKANEVQLPYGEQSVIIYQDFNFDGIEDFAIEDGQNSCYHGPSFVVYLATKDGQFEYNDGFTELAQTNCGMFGVDSEKKLLETMTKSGCCWHQWSLYDVVNNSPRQIKVFEEALVASGGFMEITDREFKNNKWVENIYHVLEWETDTLFSFEITKNRKKVILFDRGGILQYAFLTKDDKVEFAYPSISGLDIDSLLFEVRRDSTNEKREWLDFSNESAHYQIYNEPDKVGVKVSIKGKKYDMEGDIGTRKGSIASIFFDKDLSNINYVDSK